MIGLLLVMTMERTLIIIKPDGMRQNLAGEIISRYEKAGLKVIAKKTMSADRALLQQHYSAHVEKPFYPGLEKFMMETPLMVFILEGENAIAKAREVTGATDPCKAAKGTIRGDLSDDSQEKADKEKRAIRNLVHASGNQQEAAIEIKLWFPEL